MKELKTLYEQRDHVYVVFYSKDTIMIGDEVKLDIQKTPAFKIEGEIEEMTGEQCIYRKGEGWFVCADDDRIACYDKNKNLIAYINEFYFKQANEKIENLMKFGDKVLVLHTGKDRPIIVFNKSNHTGFIIAPLITSG